MASAPRLSEAKSNPAQSGIFSPIRSFSKSRNKRPDSGWLERGSAHFFGHELRGAAPPPPPPPRPSPALWDPQTPEDSKRQIEIITDETAGIVSGMVGHTNRGDTLDMELILLPLRHRGRTRSRILGALSPAMIPHWIGFDRLAHISLGSMRVIWPVGRTQTQQFARDDDPVERRRRFVVHQGGRI